MEHIYDALILGGGPAGCTAALYCARAGLDTLLVEQLFPGGQMALSSQVDNYPGFPAGVEGFSLGELMAQGAGRFGAGTLLARAEGLSLEDPVKSLFTSEGERRGRSLILATGAVARKLGLPREESLTGRGVNYCAACDGMAYRGKTVALVGGGNSAAVDALALSRICKRVFLIHRRDTLRADKVYHGPLLQAQNLEICYNSAVSALLGEPRLSGVLLRDLRTGAERELPCQGLFISVGRSPATALFRGLLELDPEGYVLADESTCTNIPGVFAAGDVRAKALRQIVTAAADGAVAAHCAAGYLGAL